VGLLQLRLSFFECQEVTDLGAKFLKKCIGENLKDLKHLELNFAGCKNVQQGVKNFLKADLSKIIPFVKIE